MIPEINQIKNDYLHKFNSSQALIKMQLAEDENFILGVTQMQAKYVSIDIETTGLNHDKCQIIQFGAVIDDFITPIKDLPKLDLYVLSDNGEYYWESYAFEMNKNIFEEIQNIHKITNSYKTSYTKLHTSASDLKYFFNEWLKNNNYNQKILIAGKNFAAFDKKFLDKISFFNNEELKFSRRYLDVGSMYYDPNLDKEDIPDLIKCVERAGFEPEGLHQAVDDAIMVVKCIRHKYGIKDVS